jgi:hypothetical protein
METVQLAITDSPYASALRELLERSGGAAVHCVEVADPMQAGVIVVDLEGLDRLPSPLPNPERVVLIARNETEQLSQAWDAGIRSVVFNEDPLSTAVLAILAAGLRVPRSGSRGQALRGGERSAGSPGARACRSEAAQIGPGVSTLRPRRDG